MFLDVLAFLHFLNRCYFVNVFLAALLSKWNVVLQKDKVSGSLILTFVTI